MIGNLVYTYVYLVLFIKGVWTETVNSILFCYQQFGFTGYKNIKYY